MTLDKLRELFAGEPAFRLKQAAQAIYRQGIGSFEEMTFLPAVLRTKLKDVSILSLTPEEVRVAEDGSAHKTAMKLADGKRIETVLMRPTPDRWTTCISSQVGCALRCSFCATGLMGFSRNLSAEEITDQVLFWTQYLRRSGQIRLSNVVYMGMGEPFLNFDNVATSLEALLDPGQFGLGARHLSVSTAGVAPGIDRFTEKFGQVNLALSLHSADPVIRSELVPINKAYPLTRLARSLKNYFRVHHRKVFIEYTLLAAENDQPRDARALARFLGEVGPKRLLHVNLIIWNPTQTRHLPSSREAAQSFADVLREEGVSVTFRKNMGQDIDAACGQLVLKTSARKEGAKREKQHL